MDKKLKRLREAYNLFENRSNGTLINTNSLGEEIASSEEALIEFWNWFGDSKVVDSNGRPLVVYHGSQTHFDSFDKGKIGSRFGKDSKGFFFTIDPSIALGGAGDYAGDKGTVKKAYLKIEDPITLEQYLNSINGSVEEDMFYGGDEIPVITIWDEDKEAILALNSSADGVILSHPSLNKFNKMFVVFDIDDIKVIK